MADTNITTEALPGPKPGGNTAKADGVQKTAIETKPEEAVALTIKQCPNDPGHAGTILLQGDPHVRCTWCHAILDE